MSVIGIAAGPEQIADKSDITKIAAVDSSGNLQENVSQIGGVDARASKAASFDVDLQILLTLRAILKVLVEQNIFERGIMDTPESLVADEASSLGMDAAA